MQIDVCMTAVCRPSVVRQTVESIKEMVIFDGELGFVLNIDVLHGGPLEIKEVMHWVHTYFPLRVTKINRNPSHLKALYSVWGASRTDYVMQWEDDWKAVNKIDLNDCLLYMEKNENVGALLFDRACDGYSVFDKGSIFESAQRDSGNFFIIKRNMGLTPCLMRGEYARQLSEAFKEVKQNIRPRHAYRRIESIGQVIDSWGKALYTGVDGKGRLVTDIGRIWQKKTGKKIKKEG